MSGEVISVLSLEGRYYNYYVYYILVLYQALNTEKNGTRSECVFH